MPTSTHSLDDTIVARATPPGDGAVAIVRLSGPAALAIGRRLAPGPARSSHRLARARLIEGRGRPLDDGLVVEMHEPRSYTGEDVVELHLHGGRSVVDAVLAACVAAGARLAEPGEFTLRAFLRGRLDLAQAEAVADLVSARSEVARRLGLAQLEGGLSRAVSDVLESLEDVLAAWRATIDFPEQVGELDAEPTHDRVLSTARTRLAGLIDGARLDLRRGQQVVLCGAPNVGKSSLLNAWAGEERVLVHEAPGTTRDPVEVSLEVGGVRLSLWDTAGLRAEAHGLERAGAELTRSRLRRADLALWLVAADAPAWPGPDLVAREVVLVGSKADLAEGAARAALSAEAAARGLAWWGVVSTRDGEGVEALRSWLATRIPGVGEAEAVVVRERHLETLRRARAALERALAARAEGVVLDAVVAEVEEAARALGELLGRAVDPEILDKIFAEFCLGK